MYIIIGSKSNIFNTTIIYIVTKIIVKEPSKYRLLKSLKSDILNKMSKNG